MRNIYASIEFGSHSIKLLVSEFYEDKQNILFIDEVLTTGIKAGIIYNKSIVYNDLKKLVSKCENFIQGKIHSVILMLPSVDLVSKELSYDITIPENRVKGLHIKNLFNKVYTEEKKANDVKGEIAFIYPNKFTSLKLKKSIDNPIGEMTRELYVSLEVVYENAQMIIDYIAIIEQLSIEVVEIVPNVVGYKNSLITKEEMQNYTCIVDIGAQQTTITVYHNQLIMKSESFKIGTSIVTEELEKQLALSYNDAEDFKITHGNCMSKEAGSEIVLEKHKPDGSITYITNEYVAKIIEEKYLDILRVIRRYLLETGLKNKIVKYILIGGGVAIENFEKLFKNNFGDEAKVRTPNIIGTRHPKFSSLISGQYNIKYLERLFETNHHMVSFDENA